MPKEPDIDQLMPGVERAIHAHRSWKDRLDRVKETLGQTLHDDGPQAGDGGPGPGDGRLTAGPTGPTIRAIEDNGAARPLHGAPANLDDWCRGALGSEARMARAIAVALRAPR
jgi:hypothetical protein